MRLIKSLVSSLVFKITLVDTLHHLVNFWTVSPNSMVSLISQNYSHYSAPLNWLGTLFDQIGCSCLPSNTTPLPLCKIHTQEQPGLIPFYQHSNRISRVFMGVLPMVLYQSGFVLYQWAVEVLSTQSHWRIHINLHIWQNYPKTSSPAS